MPIRLSETCQHISGQVKCPYKVIRRTSPFLLQLETRLTEINLQEETVGTSHADIDRQDDVSLAGMLQGALVAGRAVCYCFTPVFTPFLGDNTWFSNLSASHGRSFCVSSNRFPGSTLVIFLRGRLWLVGACACHIQPAKPTLRTSTKVASHLLSFYHAMV